jgi:hypothetical protein
MTMFDIPPEILARRAAEREAKEMATAGYAANAVLPGRPQRAFDHGPELAKQVPGEITGALLSLQETVLELRDQIDQLHDRLGPLLIQRDHMPPETVPGSGAAVRPPLSSSIGQEIELKQLQLRELISIVRSMRKRVAL